MAVLPVTPFPAVPEGAPLSQGARIVNTFIAPSKTFTDLRRSASWWVPFLIIVAFSYMFMYVMSRQVGFEQISKNEIARSPRRADQFEKAPPDQQAQQLRISVAITRYVSYAIPLFILFFYLVTAGVLTGVFNMGFGAQIPFKIFWAIVVYSGLPGIIHAVLGIISLFSGVDPEGFNINNPVATNPAYFMGSSNKFLYGMASSLDIFVWWGIVLMGIGVASNSKVKRSTAIMVIGGLYLFYKLVTSGLAAVTS
jgi:Yip1 domain